MESARQLVIIDGHALAFRSFHALSGAGLRASNGEPTYAVYGFAHFLLAMLAERQPDYVAVTFDVGRTFRHEEYPEYKAGRAETPEEFPPQLERIKQLVETLAIPIYTAQGYEADDVIGTLARQATAEQITTTILTGDTDTLQLVDAHVRVLLAQPYGKKMTSVLYGEPEVRQRYKGLAPNQLADLRGLKGDASDNIPGVKGIGETGAIHLLNEFGTVENLYDHLDEVPTRYRKKLDGQREQALTSKRLATIVCEVPAVMLDVQATRTGQYDRAEVVKLFQELEFRSLLERLPSPPAASAPPTPTPAQPESPGAGAPAGAGMLHQLSMFAPSSEGPPSAEWPGPLMHGDYRAVMTEETLREVVAALTDAPGFAFDTESIGLRPFERESDIVGISLAVAPGAAWYIPFGHREGGQLPRAQIADTLRPFFEDPDKPRYAHNAKFDIEMLLRLGITVAGVAFDTMIAAGLLGKAMALKDLAFYELALPDSLPTIDKLIGKGAKQTTFDYVPIDRALPYAAADADMTLRLVEKLRPLVEERDQTRVLFAEIEMPLIAVLVEMERAGIKLNVDYLRKLSKQMGHDIAALEQEIHQQAGGKFNINSVHQMNEVFFQRLNLPTEGLRKTLTGIYSLAAGALEKLIGTHEIVRLILRYRHLSKLRSTYVDALPKLAHTETERVHTSFNQMGTSTGRLASSSPNLQNIPVRSEEGTEIRRAFVAEPGHTFVAADYSQIELRVLAHITQDPNLIQAFQEGQDIHAATAAQLFNVPIDQVEKNQRRIAKMTVFGIIYGISGFGLAQRTDMTRSEAQALIDAFFARFPGVRGYMDRTLEQGRTHGYVESLFGRRRFMPDLALSGSRRQAAEREAINMPIQATAADIMKMAMIRVAQELRQHNLSARMVLQVHDELIFETPLDEVAAVQQVVRQAMEEVYRLDVPLKVDVEVGNNWEQMESVG